MLVRRKSGRSGLLKSVCLTLAHVELGRLKGPRLDDDVLCVGGLRGSRKREAMGWTERPTHIPEKRLDIAVVG
jgi:hypothetical protein